MITQHLRHAIYLAKQDGFIPVVHLGRQSVTPEHYKLTQTFTSARLIPGGAGWHGSDYRTRQTIVELIALGVTEFAVDTVSDCIAVVEQTRLDRTIRIWTFPGDGHVSTWIVRGVVSPGGADGRCVRCGKAELRTRSHCEACWEEVRE